jgi:hypothetical protein
MIYKNVFAKKTYMSEGVEKTSWYKVGYIKIKPDGGSFLVLNHQPDTVFYIFESNDLNNE